MVSLEDDTNTDGVHPLAVSLPYIDDRDLDGTNDTYVNDVKLHAEIAKLIEDEMKNMKPKDYLGSLGLPKFDKTPFSKNPMLKAEYERIVNNIPTEPLVAKAVSPLGSHSSATELQEQIENAQKIIEEQHIQLLNLKLLRHHGINAWKLHCGDAESIVSIDSSRAQSLSKELNDVQLQRCDLQDRNRKNLRALDHEFYMLAERNRKMRKIMKK